VSRQGDVPAFASDARLADRLEHILALGNIEFEAVEQLMFEEDDGVRITDGRLEEALRIGGVIRGDHFEAGNVTVPG
jgi:hypothetical protein